MNETAYHFIFPREIYVWLRLYVRKHTNTVGTFKQRTELKAIFSCPLHLFRDNDITGVLDHTFCVEHNAYGEIIQHELKPNGKTISVSEDTKKEYVRYEVVHSSIMCVAVGDPVIFSCSRFSCRLYVNWRFLHGIEAQFLALQKGFNEVIPQHLLKSFDEKELEVKNIFLKSQFLPNKSYLAGCSQDPETNSPDQISSILEHISY